MTAAAVNILVTEAISKTVSSRMESLFSASRKPKAPFDTITPFSA